MFNRFSKVFLRGISCVLSGVMICNVSSAALVRAMNEEDFNAIAINNEAVELNKDKKDKVSLIDKFCGEFSKQYEIMVERQYNEFQSQKKYERGKLGFKLDKNKLLGENTETKGDVEEYISKVKKEYEELEKRTEHDIFAGIFFKVVNEFLKESIKSKSKNMSMGEYFNIWHDPHFYGERYGVFGCLEMKAFLEKLYNLLKMFKAVLNEEEYVYFGNEFTGEEKKFVKSLHFAPEFEYDYKIRKEDYLHIYESLKKILTNINNGNLKKLALLKSKIFQCIAIEKITKQIFNSMFKKRREFDGIGLDEEGIMEILKEGVNEDLKLLKGEIKTDEDWNKVIDENFGNVFDSKILEIEKDDKEYILGEVRALCAFERGDADLIKVNENGEILEVKDLPKLPTCVLYSISTYL